MSIKVISFGRVPYPAIKQSYIPAHSRKNGRGDDCVNGPAWSTQDANQARAEGAQIVVNGETLHVMRVSGNTYEDNYNRKHELPARPRKDGAR